MTLSFWSCCLYSQCWDCWDVPPHPCTLCFVLTKELSLVTLSSHYNRVIILQEICEASQRVRLQSVPKHKLLLQVTVRKQVSQETRRKGGHEEYQLATSNPSTHMWQRQASPRTSPSPWSGITRPCWEKKFFWQNVTIERSTKNVLLYCLLVCLPFFLPSFFLSFIPAFLPYFFLS